MFSRISRVDIAVATVVALIGLQEVWLPITGFSDVVGPRPVLCLAYLICAAALLWRRSFPLTALLTIVFVLSAYYLVFGAPEGLGTFLPPVLAFFAVGRYDETRWFAVAFAVVVAHLALHEFRDPRFVLDGAAVVLWAIVVGVGFLGVVLRMRAIEVRDAAHRLEAVEASRAEDERRLVEAERHRLAGELHDIVGHGLSLMVLQLVAVDGTVEKGDLEAARRRLASLESAARDTLAETRRLVQVMDADVDGLSPQPGLADLPALVEKVSSAGASIGLRVQGEAAPVSTGLGLTVYRVVQEALTNVVRHARPAIGRVMLDVNADRLIVEVTDEGTGSPAAEPGRGLRGMADRVALYDGTLEAGPVDGSGYRVRAVFRLPEVST